MDCGVTADTRLASEKGLHKTVFEIVEVSQPLEQGKVIKWSIHCDILATFPSRTIPMRCPLGTSRQVDCACCRSSGQNRSYQILWTKHVRILVECKGRLDASTVIWKLIPKWTHRNRTVVRHVLGQFHNVREQVPAQMNVLDQDVLDTLPVLVCELLRVVRPHFVFGATAVIWREAQRRGDVCVRPVVEAKSELALIAHLPAVR